MGNRVEKRATEVPSREAHSRLCKRYAISDKWRGRERNRDEERARPLASHRLSLPSTQLTCPPSRFAGTMAAVLENVSTASTPLCIAPRDRSRGRKIRRGRGRKSVGNRHFLREPSLHAARGGEGSVNACITLRDSSFPCER